MKYSLLLLCVGLCVSLTSVHASDESSFLNRTEVRSYLDEIAAEHQLNRHRLAGLFAPLRSQQSIIDAISRPAERVLQWHEYRGIFHKQERIAGGRVFMQTHRDLLERAERRFGVPAEVITAIIGVETYYGRITGSYRVIEALATLAFDYPPRSAFFTRELTEFIVLAEAEGWDTLAVKGSYAGAMGMPQFIASSYREYAVDFDADGQRDLFGSHADIIGSVATYLSRHGWQQGMPIAERWQLDSALSDDVRALDVSSLKPSVSIDRVAALGFDTPKLQQVRDGSDQTPPLLSVMTLNAGSGEQTWVAYPNFYVITRYNHSRLYAMAVFQLAEAIAASL